jgi:hypothetical protein
MLQQFPGAVKHYLGHAIARIPLASAVRLQMQGEIKLKRWNSFSAEQVIRWDQGMIWRASCVLAGILAARGLNPKESSSG